MKPPLRVLFVIIIDVVGLLVPASGIQAWCKNYFEGFTLADDYNPNSPPTKNFTLLDEHILTQVNEVSMLNLVLYEETQLKLFKLIIHQFQ